MKRRQSIGPVSSAPSLQGLLVSALDRRCLETMLQQQCQRFRERLKGCQRNLSKKAIHQSRVETRRLLALMGLLSDFIRVQEVKKIDRALKRHMEIFGDLRDAQVQLQMVAPFLDRHPAARVFRAWLRDRQKRLLQRAEKRVKRIKNRHLHKLLVDGCRQVSTGLRGRPSTEVAAGLLVSIDRAFAETRAWHAQIDPADTATIHRTRVAFKRFRYMAEAVVQLCLPAKTRWLEAMRRHQVLMGHIQDTEVLLRTLGKFLGRHPRHAVELSPFHGALLRRRAVLIRTFLGTPGPLEQFWPLPPTVFNASVIDTTDCSHSERVKSLKLKGNKR